ncbi:unnamed protein product [Nezara viridula]|uniref:Uncharacterized protein n=1 Tax=Nezara viridula TaxID=85310 RepID=A0A9P0MV56_NEZVI|nr:unnamed protein product [Nezara viridula]
MPRPRFVAHLIEAPPLNHCQLSLYRSSPQTNSYVTHFLCLGGNGCSRKKMPEDAKQLALKGPVSKGAQKVPVSKGDQKTVVPWPLHPPLQKHRVF